MPSLAVAEQAPSAAAALDLSHALGLYCQLGQRQTHARKHVYDDLLRDRIVDRAPEHDVATEQAGQERIVMPFFTRGGRVAEQKHGGFVNESEEAEVTGVGASRLEDKVGF